MELKNTSLKTSRRLSNSKRNRQWQRRS